MHPVVCVDFGSTFTKVGVVDVTDGGLVDTAVHRTTVDSDVMDGLDAALGQLRDRNPTLDLSERVACSSAGGGLRLAVVGYERAVTAEAGYRVGLSAGARVVHVSSGPMHLADVAVLAADRPDLVLLVGGTDDGNAEVLLGNARTLARARLGVPVVVAGNAAVRDDVVRILRRGRVATVATDNVLPRIGVLDPVHARAAIREVFIRHVIGGKHLSERVDLADFVRAATPDAVLAGVELLADGHGSVRGRGDVVVVDVGGATTDVYSVVTPDADEAGLHRDVVETLWRSRTVEGDLGVRWNAVGIVDAALAERLVDPTDEPQLRLAAQRRAAEPGYLPESPPEAAIDTRLASLAVTVALRRHARPHTSGAARYPGKDLRRVRLVVGSGGVFRHGGPDDVDAMLAPAVADIGGGWRVPEQATTTVDQRYVLAAAGLLAGEFPAAAAALLERHLPG
ncbi:MAG TPA: glutamate mutase L [Actinomycetes bacterium]|nr:glutamate mutase L [Actinomycetes bacterium]